MTNRAPHGRAIHPADNLINRCARLTIFYGALLGVTVLVILVAINRQSLGHKAFGSLSTLALYLAMSALVGAIVGLPCGVIAAHLARRIRSPLAWMFAGAIGISPFVLPLILVDFGVGDFGLAPGYGPALLISAFIGLFVGRGIRGGRSRLPAVNSVIAAIEEHERAEPGRYGLAPGEMTPATVPTGLGDEVSPAPSPQAY